MISISLQSNVFTVESNVDILRLYRILGQKYPSSGLRHFEIHADGQFYKLIQQNPNKSSKWAELARAGKEVVQVITGNNNYKGVFVDGVYNKY